MSQITAENHFVPQFYLRNWSTDGKNIREYKVLIPHEGWPVWRNGAIRNVGRLRNLYSIELPQVDVDHFEKWFHDEVEESAAAALVKVTASGNLTSEDAEALARFALAQDLRTPKDYQQFRRRAEENLPPLLDSILTDVVEILASGRTVPDVAPLPPERSSAFLWLETLETEDGQAALQVSAEIGPVLWLQTRRRMFEEHAPQVCQHHWRLLEPAPGYEWPTSDHPVVRLGAYSGQELRLDAGWLQEGADLILPLSPRYLLHARVGDTRPYPRVLPRNLTFLILGSIYRAAHRSIFAQHDQRLAAWHRPRIVNRTVWDAEAPLWK